MQPNLCFSDLSDAPKFIEFLIHLGKTPLDHSDSSAKMIYF